MKISCRNQLNLVHTLMAVGIFAFWGIFCFKMKFFGDDPGMQKLAANFDTVVYFYMHWASRLLPIVTHIILVKSKLAFQLVTFAVLVATPLGFYLLFRELKLDVKQCFVIVALLPLWTMNSAGWAATLTNYWYPLTACVYALYFIIKKELRLWEWVLMVVLLLFCTNLELCAIGLFGLLCLMIWKARRTPQVWVALFITILMIVFTLTAPGNHARLISETKTWLPAFVDYTIVYKSYIGVMRVMQFHFFTVNVCLAFFAAAIVFLKTRRVWVSVATVVVVIILQYICSPRLGGMNAIAPFGGSFHTKHYLGVAVIAIEIGALLWCVLTATIEMKTKILIVAVSSLAFAIPSLLGFSPTVWASSDRTILPCEFLLIGIGAVLFRSFGCSRDDLWKVLYFCLMFQIYLLARLLFTM